MNNFDRPIDIFWQKNIYFSRVKITLFIKTGVLMRKVLVLVCLTLLVFSCKKNKTTEDKNTIQFWNFWGEPNQKGVLKSLVQEFEKKYNAKVEITDLSWNDGKTKLFAAFNSKTAPDVLELGSDWVAQFSSAGVLMELNKDSMNLDKYVKFSLEPSFWDSKLYALPWVVDTRVLFYNRDLLKKAGLKDQAPKTFDELLAACVKINEINGLNGFGANGSDRHKLYKKIIPMFWSNGGTIFDDKGNPVVNSKANIAALNMYVDLSRDGMIETQRQIDAAFVKGDIGFWFSGGWLLTKIHNENPNLNYAVAPMPGMSVVPGISFAGGEYLAISSNSQNPELAKKFIKFMTDGMNSIKFCKQVIEAGFPADKNYYMDPYYQSQPDRMVFAHQLDNSRMTPVHPQWLDIEAVIEDATVQAIYGNKSAEEALNDANYQITKIIKK